MATKLKESGDAENAPLPDISVRTADAEQQDGAAPLPDLSVRTAVHSFLFTREKVFRHNRMSTIGASEVGQCARRVWFLKNGEAPDQPEQPKGAAVRGDMIEAHVWVPAMRAYIENLGGKLLFAGDNQQTLTDGYLSCTPDGLAIFGDHCIPVECKSIDPRVALSEVKSEHRAQVQVQLGILRQATEWRPDRALISYINASFFDAVEEFWIPFDERVYGAARARALKIMDATSPLGLRPEGKMAGGRECEHCPWSSRCAHEQAAGVPAKADVELGDNAWMALEGAVQRYQAARGAGEAAKAEEAEAKEEIKEILRAHGCRRFDGGDWSISWSAVKGRSTIDLEAAKAAGVDLSPFAKEGDPSERLLIKATEKELEK